jgi:mRNA interferase MazF
MAYVGKVYRWELYWADLEPHVGTEQAGRRPVLIVSGDHANASFGTVTIVPLTKLEGKGRSPAFFEVELPQGTVPNGLTSLALPHQIRSISKTRLLKWIGILDADEARRAMENGILDHLGIEFDEEE